jgi:hypothetical protein
MRRCPTSHIALSLVLGIASLAGLASVALGQADMKFGGEPMPAWVAAQVQNPDDPRAQAYAQQQRRRVEIERDLYKLRAEYFRNVRNTQIRQIGISKLRKYTDPAIYPSLLKIFKGEKMDVRAAVLDILAEGGNDLADTTLTWAAIFDPSKEFRDAAAERLMRRIKESGGGATARIKSVVAQGLREGDEDELGAAAHLAQTLGLVEAIPMLISAQLGGGTAVGSVGGDSDNHSLAWILVGTQTAFVSDLQPVVGDSAVAFDPQLSVVTEGVYLRVIDAVVVTYRYEVHNSLVGLTSDAWGQPTERLGWDTKAWQRWYAEDFKPYWAAKEAATAADKPK